MISLLFFVFLTLIGIVLLLVFSPALSLIEFIGVGLVIGSLFYTWSVFLISLFLPLSSAIWLGIMFWFLLTFSIFYLNKGARGRFKKIASPKIGREEIIFLIIEGLFVLIFLWLFSQIILSPSAQGWHVGLNSFGDTQFHVAAIANFAYGENIPPQNPLFAGIFFSYPFIADFLSAVLVKLGESLRLAMLIPTIIFSLSTVQFIFILTRRLTKSILAPVFTLIFFLFNGGMGFWYFLKDSQGKQIMDTLLSLQKDYTHIFEENMHFTNIISGFLEQERSLLFGLPIFCLIFIFLLHEKDKKSVSFLLVLTAVLYGLLPLTHSHAFFVITAAVGWYVLFDLIYCRGKSFKKWLVFFLLGFLLALPQLLAIFPQVSTTSGGFIRQYWGWMKKPEGNWFIYWFKTVGPILFLTPLALIAPKISYFLKFLFMPFLIIFFAANFWLFQPYNWDNVKFFIFVLLASSILAGELLAKWWERGKLNKVLVVFLLFLSSVSGLLSIWAEPKPHNLLYSNKDIEAAEFIREKTEPKAVFLTGPQHNSPALLAGRKILVGYQGYLWVHGIDSSKRDQDIKRMYQTNSPQEFLALSNKYKITYVLIGPIEKEHLRPNLNFFNQNLKMIFDNGLYQVYSNPWFMSP